MTDEKSGADWSGATRVFDEHRDLLIAVAYRVLGSVTDAEDVVQEAWLRWVNARPPKVADPRAFLVRVSTRLAIDRLRVASRPAASPTSAPGCLSRFSPAATSQKTWRWPSLSRWRCSSCSRP